MHGSQLPIHTSASASCGNPATMTGPSRVTRQHHERTKYFIPVGIDFPPRLTLFGYKFSHAFEGR